jgi:hypothetical protein
MERSLIWVASATFRGYGCSDCGWVFRASGPLVGDTLEEMKRLYEIQRDKEFTVHNCAKHPRTISSKPKWRYPIWSKRSGRDSQNLIRTNARR